MLNAISKFFFEDQCRSETADAKHSDAELHAIWRYLETLPARS